MENLTFNCQINFLIGFCHDFLRAYAQGSKANSIVKISLSHLFRRSYSSITDVLGNLFRNNQKQPPEINEIREEQFKILVFLANECPKPIERTFSLFAVDCTANPRIYSKTVKDRSFVHAPNHIPGQKPVTVGHQYSHVIFLPEKKMIKMLIG